MFFTKRERFVRIFVGCIFLSLKVLPSWTQDRNVYAPAVSTNLIDWVLVTPNVGVDIPLTTPSYIDAASLYIEGKMGLDANNIYMPDLTYRLLSGKIEYRRHFRFGENMDACSRLTRATNIVAEWLSSESYWKKRKLNKVDDKGRSYVGLFTQYADYSFYVPLTQHCKGRIGKAAIAGISLGYQKPLYNFSNRYFLEWELGGSLGCVISHFYRYNKEESAIASSGNWYYPMVTDLHISLVLRKHSVKDLYKKSRIIY